MNPYVLADGWLQQLLSDDVPHGDLTSWVLDLGQQDGQMQFSARYAMVLCGSEEARRLGEMNGLRAVGAVRPSGSRLQAGEPILTLAGQLASAHAQARDLVAELPHHRLGRAPVVGQPLRFDGAKPLAPTGAPALGADTRAVLDGLGLSAEQIAGLVAAGIVQETQA